MLNLTCRLSVAAAALVVWNLALASAQVVQPFPNMPRPGFSPPGFVRLGMTGAPMVSPAMSGAAAAMARPDRTLFSPPQFTGGFSQPMLMGYSGAGLNGRTMPFQGYSPMSYPGMMPYQYPGMGMYGGQNQQYDQTASGNYSRMYSESSRQEDSQAKAEERFLSRVLSASGVPNDNGHVRWPIGLKILAGKRTEELRQQIDAAFQVAASEASTGPANANVAKQLVRDLQELQDRLLTDKRERFRLPSRVYEESEAFLTKLNAAEKVLAAGLATQTELKPANQQSYK